MDEVAITNYIDTLSNAIFALVQFSNMVTRNHQALREPQPMWNFKDQMRKILEEVREYSHAVTETQGNPEEHTRAHQIEEGFDVMMATLTSYTILNLTKEEIHQEVTTIVKKFNERKWLD